MRGAFEPEFVALFREAIEKLKPDMVIADYFTVFGVLAADELGIPVVIVSSVPYTFLNRFISLYSPSETERHCKSCCGCLCICPVKRDLELAIMRKMAFEPDLSEMFESYYRRSLIVSSFWGFDSPMHTAPNVHLTGPFFSGDTG